MVLAVLFWLSGPSISVQDLPDRMPERSVAGRRAHQSADVDAGVELAPRPPLTEEECAALAAERAARGARNNRGGENRWGCACNLPYLLCCAQTRLHLLPLITRYALARRCPCACAVLLLCRGLLFVVFFAVEVRSAAHVAPAQCPGFSWEGVARSSGVQMQAKSLAELSCVTTAAARGAATRSPPAALGREPAVTAAEAARATAGPASEVNPAARAAAAAAAAAATRPTRYASAFQICCACKTAAKWISLKFSRALSLCSAGASMSLPKVC